MTKSTQRIITIALIASLALFPSIGLPALITYLAGVILMFWWDIGNNWSKTMVIVVPILLGFILASWLMVTPSPSMEEMRVPAQSMTK